jgi:hypothetical protein
MRVVLLTGLLVQTNRKLITIGRMVQGWYKNDSLTLDWHGIWERSCHATKLLLRVYRDDTKRKGPLRSKLDLNTLCCFVASVEQGGLNQSGVQRGFSEFRKVMIVEPRLTHLRTPSFRNWSRTRPDSISILVLTIRAQKGSSENYF